MTLKRPNLTMWLGRSVTVTVDRPLGSPHPNHPDLVYPVNYGSVAGTVGGDGQPIDAYVLGVAEAVPTAQGVVVAVVQRADDVEDKLVVAAAGRRSSRAEIERLIRFQERFFASSIVCWGERQEDASPMPESCHSERSEESRLTKPARRRRRVGC